MADWDLGIGRLWYIKEYTVGDPTGGVTTLETLWHTKIYKGLYIECVIYLIYVYTHREKYIMSIYWNIIYVIWRSCITKVWRENLLHSLHVARYTLATRSSTAQVCYIKKWWRYRCCHWFYKDYLNCIFFQTPKYLFISFLSTIGSKRLSTQTLHKSGPVIYIKCL